MLFQVDSLLTLTVAEGVPEGLYHKLHLHVTSVVFTPEPAMYIRLPGETLDLNATGRFTVEPGGTPVVSLDLDVAQTLSMSSGGVLRPVVFVDVATAVPDPQPPAQPPGGKLVRLQGPVEAVVEVTGDFHLCPARLPHCVHVRTDDA